MGSDRPQTLSGKSVAFHLTVNEDRDAEQRYAGRPKVNRAAGDGLAYVDCNFILGCGSPDLLTLTA